MARSNRPALTRSLQRRYASVLAMTGEWYTDDSQRWQRRYSNSRAQTPDSIAWAAYYFAREWNSRDIDLARLQNIVVRFGTARCVLLYASRVPGANVRKLQRSLMARGSIAELRDFSKIPGADLPSIERMILVREVMAM